MRNARARFHEVLCLILTGGLTVVACAKVSNPRNAQGDAGRTPDAGNGGLKPEGGVDVSNGGPPRPDTSGNTGRSCKVPANDLDATLKECTRRAPAMAFEPKLKWSWSESPRVSGSYVIPLVANLTDDNGDGVVDLCDVPDVVVTTGTNESDARVHVLAGDTGKLQFELEGRTAYRVTPALGDLDGDGVAEIVVRTPSPEIKVAIYDNKGRLKLKSEEGLKPLRADCGAISIYDLDADGHPEIVLNAQDVFNYQGKHLFSHDFGRPPGELPFCPTDAAADLDGDGKLEVILGSAVFHADGQKAFDIAGPIGVPQIANLDDDPEPEILLSRPDGMVVLEADGRVKFGPKRFVQSPAPLDAGCSAKPQAIHDFDGDRKADLAVASCDEYQIYGLTPTGVSFKWSYPINDPSGIAGSTAFDFLGRGFAQAVYADERDLMVLDGRTGALNFTQRRTSGTIIEYPVVADVDSDDSADILVVSNSLGGQHPTLQVFQDAQKRWVPTRRIWNQHSYFVTNVREDGTIPKVMPKHWLRNNTFRVNAQIDGTSACAPPVVE